MLSLSKLFPPGREEGLKRLHAFVPHAGRVYAASRNADLGSGLRQNVSMLSPYIRYRLITEREVVAAVLAQHTPEQAEKFIQEVFWRTYWKGWLQMRPQVWTDFLVERDTERARVGQSAELQKALADAEA
ncbi:MAG: DNA photolyase FAD-binding protein, partial [Pseudomonadota bacterium]